MGRAEAFVAFDLGAESGRVILGRLDGERLSLKEVYRFTTAPVALPDGLHTDVLHIFSEMKQGLARAAAECNGKLAGVGVDGWGVDFALLDRQGALLGNPYHYRDRLTVDILPAIFQRISPAEIFEFTGVQPMPINTLCQLYALKLRGAPVLEMAERLLMLPDLFNYWLSGRMAAEACIASTSQCYDLRSGRWAEELLQRLDLSPRLFPEVIAPGTRVGSLLPEVAAECGLEAAVPVFVPGCHDTALAVAAVPAQDEKFAYLSSGTWSLLGVELPAPCITPQSLAAGFTNEAGVGGTVRLLKNLTGLWLVQECRRAWGRFSYVELMQLASQAPLWRSLIDTQDPVFARPGDMPQHIRDYCLHTGQPVPDSEGAVIRCVLESLALEYRRTLEQLDALTNCRREPVHIVGGGAHNALLCQFVADACHRRVVAGPAEATAAGNVLMQALAAGRLTSVAAIRTVVGRSFVPATYMPAAERKGWDAAYDRYLALKASVAA